MSDIKLLLVDDEAEFREVTSQALSRRGFRVSQAESGERALEMVREDRPDILVLDLRMEGMDGIETLARMRTEGLDLPVIILTGHGGFEDAMSGIQLGIVDFLQKPVDLEQLGAHIRQLLAKGRRGPLKEKTITELMVPLTAYRRVYDYQPVREVVQVLKEVLFPKMTGEFTEQGHRTVLVYNRDEKYVGCVRISDILDQVLPVFLKDSPYASYFTGMFLAQAKLLANLLVGDLVGDSSAVDIEAPLMEAVHLIVSHRLINLPVLKDGEAVGVLRDKDLLMEISELMALGR